MASLQSIGTCSRTRLASRDHGAAYPCLATVSPPNPSFRYKRSTRIPSRVFGCGSTPNRHTKRVNMSAYIVIEGTVRDEEAPKDFSESRVDTDLHGGQFILVPPWPVAVPESFTPTPSCRTSARRDRGSPKRNRACGTSPPAACIGLDHRGWRHEWRTDQASPQTLNKRVTRRWGRSRAFS